MSDGWNLFDVLVVGLSLIALGPVAMPINVLRCGPVPWRTVDRLRGMVSKTNLASITGGPVLKASMASIVRNRAPSFKQGLVVKTKTV